jgi:anti-sigma factor RsiW
VKINRHNYEEYFILYMDNELSAEERRMVEVFVQHHPDLKDDLDTLMQFKLTPDTHIVFEGKEELMKENGHSIITLNNFEEWLSLYIDNELTSEQRQLVEKFTAANQAAQKELDILQKVKLQPESIIFPNKSQLYRKEEKTRRIAPVYWRAAAAVLVIVLGISAVIFVNKKPSVNEPEIAAKTQQVPAEPGTDNNKTAVVPMQKEEPVNNQFIAEVNKQPGLSVESTDQINTVNTKKKPVEAGINNNTAGANPGVIKNDEPVIAVNNNSPSNNLPQPADNPNVTIDKPADAIAYSSTPDKNKLQNTLSNPAVTSRDAQPLNIIQASYNENDDDVFDQADEKKNKNRGIFRKIVRTFEKRTNIDATDDNKLLVAGLSIKLK